MLARFVDPISDPAWARLVERAPAATPFHDPLWLDLLREHYRYPIAAACAFDPSGAAVAGIPVAAVASRLTGRRLVAIPFADLCPPLVAPDAPPDALGAVTTALHLERSRRDVPLEIRWELPEAGEPVDLFLRHVVDLRGGIDAVWKRMKSSARRNVRAAERAGVRVVLRTDRGALDLFYGLHVATRHRLGVPTQPRGFIRGLERFLEADRGFVAVAMHAGRPLAASVFLAAGDLLVYKYGASDEDALDLRPNNALFMDVMRAAVDRGYTSLALGRTDFGQEGLRRFKLGWGADEAIVAYTYAGCAPRVPGSSRAERALGEVIRRTPPVAGRLAGELLYRHAG